VILERTEHKPLSALGNGGCAAWWEYWTGRLLFFRPIPVLFISRLRLIVPSYHSSAIQIRSGSARTGNSAT